jgi:hypothetical protein
VWLKEGKTGRDLRHRDILFATAALSEFPSGPRDCDCGGCARIFGAMRRVNRAETEKEKAAVNSQREEDE